MTQCNVDPPNALRGGPPPGTSTKDSSRIPSSAQVQMSASRTSFRMVLESKLNPERDSNWKERGSDESTATVPEGCLWGQQFSVRQPWQALRGRICAPRAVWPHRAIDVWF